MRAWFWRRGRFSWVFVIGVAYTTLVLYGFDYSWRMVEAPFEAVLAGGAGIYLAGLMIIRVVANRWAGKSADY